MCFGGMPNSHSNKEQTCSANVSSTLSLLERDGTLNARRKKIKIFELLVLKFKLRGL